MRNRNPGTGVSSRKSYSGGSTMTKKFWLPLMVAVAAAMALPACTETTTSRSTGDVVDDSAMTSKVKTALMRDSGLAALKIDVNTYKDTVQLSGFVNNPTEKNRATEIAQTVQGVRRV